MSVLLNANIVKSSQIHLIPNNKYFTIVNGFVNTGVKTLKII
jgi:hypothetical protein